MLGARCHPHPHSGEDRYYDARHTTCAISSSFVKIRRGKRCVGNQVRKNESRRMLSGLEITELPATVAIKMTASHSVAIHHVCQIP